MLESLFNVTHERCVVWLGMLVLKSFAFSIFKRTFSYIPHLTLSTKKGGLSRTQMPNIVERAMNHVMQRASEILPGTCIEYECLLIWYLNTLKKLDCYNNIFEESDTNLMSDIGRF